MQHNFEIIKNNVIVDGNDLSPDEGGSRCNCKSRHNAPTCIDASCVNFATQTECVQCNPHCNNNHFTQRKYRRIEVRDAFLKGRGLFALEDIPANTFIYEYMGEIVNYDTLEERMEKSFNEPHLYVMQIKPNNFIDARYKGNISRYINHSCEPNCHVDMWNVAGHIRVGVFSTVPISEGTELTFDYSWSLNERPPTRCYCGTASCRGYLEVLTEDQINKLNTRRGAWVPSTELTDAASTNCLLITPSFLVEKRIKIFFDGNQSFFEADVLEYRGKGCYLVRYLFDEEEKVEKLVDMPLEAAPSVSDRLSEDNTEKLPEHLELWQYLDESKQEITIKKKVSSSADDSIEKASDHLDKAEDTKSQSSASTDGQPTNAVPRTQVGFGLRPQQVRDRLVIKFNVVAAIVNFSTSYPRAGVVARLIGLFEKEYEIKIYESQDGSDEQDVTLVLFGEKDKVADAKGNLVLRTELIMEEQAANEEKLKQQQLNYILQAQPMIFTNDWRRHMHVKHYIASDFKLNAPSPLLSSEMLPSIPALPLHDKVMSTIVTLAREHGLIDRIIIHAVLLASRCLDMFPVSTLGDLSSFAVGAIFCALKSSGNYKSRHSSICLSAYSFRAQELEKEMLKYMKYDIYVPNLSLLLEPTYHTANADKLLMLLLQHCYDYAIPPEYYQLACIVLSILLNVTPSATFGAINPPDVFVTIYRALMHSKVVPLSPNDLARLVQHIVSILPQLPIKQALSELITMNNEWMSNVSLLLSNAFNVIVQWCNHCFHSGSIVPAGQVLGWHDNHSGNGSECDSAAKRARPNGPNDFTIVSASLQTKKGQGNTSDLVTAPKEILQDCYYNIKAPICGSTRGLRNHFLLPGAMRLPAAADPIIVAKCKHRQLFITNLDASRLHDDNLQHVFPNDSRNIIHLPALEFTTSKTIKYELKRGVTGVSAIGLHEIACYQHSHYCASSSINILSPVAIAETRNEEVFVLFHPLSAFLPLTLISDAAPDIRLSLASDFVGAVAHCLSVGIVFKYFELDAVMVNNQGKLMLGGFSGASFGLTPTKPKPVSINLNFIGMYAPELILGGEVTRASSVYSVGIALSYILLGSFVIPPAATEAKQLEYIYKILGTPEKLDYKEYSQLPFSTKYRATVTHDGKEVQCKRNLQKKLTAAISSIQMHHIANQITSLLDMTLHLPPNQRCSINDLMKVVGSIKQHPTYLLQAWVEKEHSKVMLKEGW